MGIFGESYSKEAFDEAQKDLEVKKSTYGKLGSLEGVDKVDRQNVYDFYSDEVMAAQKRLEKLLGSGQKEATALNEKFDRLNADANAAVQKLYDFCKDELGMTEGGEDSSQK